MTMAQEKRFFRVLGQSSKHNELLRPLFIGKTYVFNPPKWLKLALGVASTFMPRRSIERTWIHPGRIGHERSQLCHYARRLLGDGSSLPTFLGGTLCCDHIFPDLPQVMNSGKEGQRPRIPACLGSLPPPPAWLRIPSESHEDLADVEYMSITTCPISGVTHAGDSFYSLPPSPMSMVAREVESGSAEQQMETSYRTFGASCAWCRRWLRLCLCLPCRGHSERALLQ